MCSIFTCVDYTSKVKIVFIPRSFLHNMYATKLWRHSKLHFFVLAFFMLVFALVNRQWGTVATPALCFAMYSTPFNATDTQRVYIITVNGQPLNFLQYSLTERDLLITPLDLYSEYAAQNTSVYTAMQQWPFIGRFVQANDYSIATAPAQFTSWYKRLVQKITGSTVNSLQVATQTYVIYNGVLTATGAPQKLNDIAP
jgi:hypothetical protein